MRIPGFISFLAISFILTVSGQISGQNVSSASSSSASSTAGPYMPVSDVREGMTGKARTVFKGTEPEEFDVEILGVVPGGIGPKQDLIVGRISGGNADRTAVFAGMSGSPVYINGKLVGAISYSFPFAKEPICGITPIEQMISIFEEKHTATMARKPRAFSFAELAGTDWRSSLPTAPAASGLVAAPSADSGLAVVAGQGFRPIATPITFTGISQATLNVFASQMINAGILPVASLGGAAPISPMKKADETTLNGGDSVSMELTRGDYSMAASGTVTLRDGNRIYAFGHPFLGLGSSDLPMSESHVVTVVPNVNNSFKLAVPDAMVGSMTQDRATGVFGDLGKAPAMIPVRLNLTTSRGGVEKFNMEITRDEFLTPLLLNIAIYNALTAQERGLGDTTVTVKADIDLASRGKINIERRFAGAQAPLMASGSVVAPTAVLIRSRFDELEIKGINIDLKTEEGTRTATLDRLAVEKTAVRPNETLEIKAYARTPDGKLYVERIPVTIPADTPAGKLTIMVGDGSQVQKDSAVQQFVPQNLGDLIQTINKLKSSDRLYAVITRSSPGAVIGSNELPDLPPSVLATINNDRMTGGVKPVVNAVVTETALPPAELIITGQQTLSIDVVK